MAKEKGKQKRVAAKKQLYEREIPDFLFSEGLEMKRQSKKKKPQRSRYKDETPDFLFRTCMSKVRNTGIFNSVLVNGHIYIIVVMLRSRNTNTDFFMILA